MPFFLIKAKVILAQDYITKGTVDIVGYVCQLHVSFKSVLVSCKKEFLGSGKFEVRCE